MLLSAGLNAQVINAIVPSLGLAPGCVDPVRVRTNERPQYGLDVHGVSGRADKHQHVKLAVFPRQLIKRSVV
jgi:hypothetical protein